MEDYTKYLNDGADTLVTLVTNWGVQVVGAIAVLIVGRWVAGRLRKGVVRGLERAAIDAALQPFLSGVVYYLVIIVTLVAVLGLFGIETTSLIAVLGGASVGISLAWQGTLSNFAAGMMLLIFRPFRPGHYVEVAGTAGSVREIGIFSTVLATPDNVQITVPNSSIFGTIIKNYSANSTRRNDIVMGIAYTDDIGVAMKTIQTVVEADPRVLKEPAPVIAVSELADSSVNIVVRPWCNATDYAALRSDLLRNLKEQLEAAGCSIPFPQTDVHLFQEKGAAAS
ncbi:MAG: mechanosensitive ion channel [Candidatus Binatia bacterium]|nr:mechanosensitive ion channel [Candidatus Binatia bacterium]